MTFLNAGVEGKSGFVTLKQTPMFDSVDVYETLSFAKQTKYVILNGQLSCIDVVQDSP